MPSPNKRVKRGKQASKFDDMSPTAKRAFVIAEGNRIERLVCPLCSYNQVVESTNRGLEDARFADVRGIILQVVYGGGRGSGFHAHKPECLTLKQMKQNTKYGELLQRIREQAEEILEELS